MNGNGSNRIRTIVNEWNKMVDDKNKMSSNGVGIKGGIVNVLMITDNFILIFIIIF